MQVHALINTLVRRGASVRLENGDQLRVKPATALTEKLRGHIRSHKAEIVAFLVGENLGPFDAPRTVTCAALERGLPITSFGWPKGYRPADFAAELESAQREIGAAPLGLENR